MSEQEDTRSPYQWWRCIWNPEFACNNGSDGCKPFARLRVKVERGVELLSKDFGIFRSTSDPYVTISVNGGPENWKTEVIKETLAPKWEQSFELDINHPLSWIRFRVFDKDFGSSVDEVGNSVMTLLGAKDDFMGWVDVHLGHLPPNRIEGGWLDLHHPDDFANMIAGEFDKDVRPRNAGKIHIELELKIDEDRHELFAMFLPVPKSATKAGHPVTGNKPTLDLSELVVLAQKLYKKVNRLSETLQKSLEGCEKVIGKPFRVWILGLFLVWQPTFCLPVLIFLVGMIVLRSKYHVEEPLGLQLVSDDQIQWMWGDAGLLGQGTAELNPLRWSSAKTASDTILELEKETGKNSKRLVQMVVKRNGKVFKEVTFSNINEAMAALMPQDTSPHVRQTSGDAIRAIVSQSNFLSPRCSTVERWKHDKVQTTADSISVERTQGAKLTRPLLDGRTTSKQSHLSDKPEAPRVARSTSSVDVKAKKDTNWKNIQFLLPTELEEQLADAQVQLQDIMGLVNPVDKLIKDITKNNPLRISIISVFLVLVGILMYFRQWQGLLLQIYLSFVLTSEYAQKSLLWRIGLGFFNFFNRRHFLQELDWEHRSAHDHHFFPGSLKQQSTKSHIFLLETFLTPTACQHCGNLLWGVTNQGFQCSLCQKIVCHSCERMAEADCPGPPEQVEKAQAGNDMFGFLFKCCSPVAVKKKTSIVLEDAGDQQFQSLTENA